MRIIISLTATRRNCYSGTSFYGKEDNPSMVKPNILYLHSISTEWTEHLKSQVFSPYVGEDNGWIVYGLANGTNFNVFNGQWNVPTAPQNPNDGQIVYLFTGLMDQGEDEIIQPVLQFGVSEGISM